MAVLFPLCGWPWLSKLLCCKLPVKRGNMPGHCGCLLGAEGGLRVSAAGTQVHPSGCGRWFIPIRVSRRKRSPTGYLKCSFTRPCPWSRLGCAWTKKLCDNKCVLFSTTKTLVICYVAIGNEYKGRYPLRLTSTLKKCLNVALFVLFMANFLHKAN